MSETNGNLLPTVIVFYADAVGRRRIEEFLRREVFVECLVAAPGITPGDIPSDWAWATLRLAEVTEGAAVDCTLSASCSEDELRRVIRLLVIVATLRNSLAASRRSEDTLQQLAATDSLTGLANRRAWDESLQRECRTATAQNKSLAIAILDLDHFKQVNDAHGHAVGDAVLQATAEGLRRAVRRGDLAARIGGDEFGLLLSGVGAEAAATVVERIRRAVVASIDEARLPTTTCSAGFAAEQGSAVVEDRLYAAAASALQAAKQAGRNVSARA